MGKGFGNKQLELYIKLLALEICIAHHSCISSSIVFMPYLLIPHLLLVFSNDKHCHIQLYSSIRLFIHAILDAYSAILAVVGLTGAKECT